MFLLLYNPFGRSGCYVQSWAWPLDSEPVPSTRPEICELGTKPAHLKHITSDIPRGGEEGLLARKQRGFWLLEIGFSNFNPLAKGQLSSEQLSYGLQKNSDTKLPAPALHVNTTAFFERCTPWGAGSAFRKRKTFL